MLDWLIVGGGPHGTHMAIRLLDKGVQPDKLAILDPNPEPLARWKHHTENTGMTHLRSPEVHSLDVDPLSLGPHAHTDSFIAAKGAHKEECSRVERDFIPPYSRPSLRLFMHHAEFLAKKSGLMQCWKEDRAQSLTSIEGGYRVHTEAGDQVEASNVVLALGMGDQPSWPGWAIP